ncbi:beta-ketoacyl-ACP synthase III [Streptomyces sp. NPDC007818]|uniref:beta-ketoacyl-ACP synthase III n=1 Tax=Streptomyces sp. NPDC007818 TaxID=3364780 RepID=UPI0036977432
MTAARNAGAPAAVLCGLGTWLPSTVVPNDEVAERLGVTDDWIHRRTGVRSRHRVDPGEATVAMAVEAGTRALKSQGHGQADAVLLATATPDRLIPSCAPEIASRLGLTGVAALDVNAACSGFVYALSVAAGQIATGTAERVLVIGADTMSSVVDPEDRTTAAIFGDGAGAVVLRAGRADEPGALGPFVLGSDGTGADLLATEGGGSRTRHGRTDEEPRPYLRMEGRHVFRHAVDRMGGAIREAADRRGWGLPAVDRVAIHQANARIAQALSTSLAVPGDRWLSNIEHVANTSSASVPLLLDHSVRNGSLAPGRSLVIAAFGAGLTWGATTVVWPELTPGE